MQTDDPPLLAPTSSRSWRMKKEQMLMLIFVPLWLIANIVGFVTMFSGQ